MSTTAILGINATTGKITGTPKYPGTYTIALSARNPGGTGPVTNLAYTVAPNGTPPSITGAASATGYPGTAYTATSGLYIIAGSGTPTLFGASAPGGGILPAWLEDQHGHGGALRHAGYPATAQAQYVRMTARCARVRMATRSSS